MLVTSRINTASKPKGVFTMNCPQCGGVSPPARHSQNRIQSRSRERAKARNKKGVLFTKKA